MTDPTETRIDSGGETDKAPTTTETASEPAPKKKRVADRQITQDDPDDDSDANDEPKDLNDPFPKASEDVLAKRKIVKVKRPTPTVAASGIADASSNPFASTSLTATTQSSSNTNGTKKVFGSGSAFSGFQGFGSGTSTGFGTSASGGGGFGTSASSSGFGSTSKSTGFGTVASTDSAEKEKKTTPSLFGSSSGSSGFSFGFAKTASTSPSTADAATSAAAVTLPENVELTTGEEDEIKLCEVRCKSFKWVEEEKIEEEPKRATTEEHNPSVKPSSDFENVRQDSSSEQKSQQDKDKSASEEAKSQHRWQELGIGPIKILRSCDFPDKYRLVQRRESTPNGPAHKVILNVPLWKEATCKKTSEKHLSVTTVGSSGEGETYALKFKEAEQAAVFSEQVHDVCSQAKSCFASA